MAIGTTAAILGAAAIGGGTALVSGAQQAKAAKQSAQAVQNATDKSAETQKYIFDTIRSDTATQRQAGDAATRQIAAIMGLNLNPTASTQPTAQPATQVPQNALRPIPGGLFGQEQPGLGGGMRLAQGGRTLNALSSPTVGTTQYGQSQQVPSTTSTTTPAQSPTDWLRNTPGYQFNFDEGQRAMNASLAARGGLLSGEAGREAIRYGQNYGDRIFNQERNALFNLAGMGQVSQGQSNQAGQSYANNMSNLNMNNANALASSYQNRANAWTNALGGVAGAGMWALGKF